MSIRKSLLAGLAGLTVAAALPVAPATAEEPKAVNIVAPDYPKGAERRKIEGYVLIQFDINPDGSTSNPSVIEAEPAGVFDAAAIQAVAKWKFEASSAGAAETKKKLSFKL